MKTKLLFVAIVWLSFSIANAQNLINPSTWTVGSGSVAGFTQYGTTSENSREIGLTPYNTNEVLWKASPDASANADGGFYSPNVSIDHTKTYRLSVWVKKTGSNSGVTQLKPQSYSGGIHHTTDLNGTSLTWHPFWYGDLPELGKWYLLVGYIHGSGYNSTVSYGRIYDATTGEVVLHMNDHKFKPTATLLRHRTILYGSTNTSDRQYMYNPRIDKVTGDEPSVEELIGLTQTDGNLLSQLPAWTEGIGSTSGYGQNGVDSENTRELGKNHVGEEVILWKASPNAGGYPSGGWNSMYRSINPSQSYRFSVWMKKTNSHDGESFFGPYRSNSILKLNGTLNNNPYFWSGDLPKLGRWYLLVGYVHKSSYGSSTNLGRIYDGVTGEVVKTITDFKFKNTATHVRHRTYLYYDSNTSDRQYMYAPRIDPITGNEPTIQELLRINDNSKLLVSYDLAGNQKQAFYCNDPDYCSPTAGKKEEKEQAVAARESAEEQQEETNSSPETTLPEALRIYPNPSNGNISLQIPQKLRTNIHSITLYNTLGVTVKKVPLTRGNKISIDITDKPAGVYFIHIHVNEGESITKKIIKN